MQVNHRELSLVISEANTLSSKATLNKQEERRLTYLMSAAAAIRSGASLAELEIENHNAISRENGLPTIRKAYDGLTQEQRDTARLWKYAVEQRDVEGAPMLNHIGIYTGLGSFVPNDFFANVVKQIKAHSPLFDEEFCTVINSTNGRVLSIPCMSDVENNASIVSESGSQTATDIYHPSHVLLGSFAYKTPRYVASMESFQDLAEIGGIVKLFQDFASERLRRGIGNDLVNGYGDNATPLGLLASLEAVGSTYTAPIIAAGAAVHTGGAETGANSIGMPDLSNLYYSIDSAYRNNPKCFWLMSDQTLNYIDGLLVTKLGQKLDLVKWDSGMPKIFGKRVFVDPSMPGIGASNTSVVFGDFAYWFTRICTGSGVGTNGNPLSYVQTYTEAPDLIEKGNVGFRAFLRAGGALAFVDRGSPAPLNLLMQHS